jgi:polysaccharide pyruvyl transferase WcaK-like protein
MRVSRRAFLQASSAFMAGCAASPAPRGPAKLLLRSSWQTVNIGDIAHTPGMLRLIEEHLPGSEVTLWPNALSAPVEKMLRARFPRLRIAATSDQQKAALSENDFCLHGSGPGLVGAAAMKSWQATGKPYGFGGVTLSDAEIRDQRALLGGARFVYCRDTTSLEALKASGLAGPAMEFGPDATFALDLRDDARAGEYLRANALEPGAFACFVPRLRFTPYWKEGRKMAADEVARREAENEKHREADHAKIRAAIAAWVRETGKKALLCPEMTYQVELLRPLLFDPLPEDVKPRVVTRPSYWLTDEAASTYARAAAVVSLEMHSPIIAVANGVPAIHVRQPTDTRKGQMWRDVGLGDWLFEVDASSGDQMAAALLAIHRDPGKARASAARARDFASARDAAMMARVALG